MRCERCQGCGSVEAGIARKGHPYRTCDDCNGSGSEHKAEDVLKGLSVRSLLDAIEDGLVPAFVERTEEQRRKHAEWRREMDARWAEACTPRRGVDLD